ncbi:MAG: hypothetical protein HY261_01725 [Chloroflexi bacterium]|nr:hypothetical protein [Chloroflexota bacterium]
MLEFVEQEGRLDYLSPGKGGGPVREALEALAKYHEDRMWVSTAELIETVIRERRMIEACFAQQRPREHWRRLRFVVQQARRFTEAVGGSLREFLDWIERLADEGARFQQSAAPDADEDAVRIMTIHGAKGLEFPIVVLAGLTASPSNRTGSVLFDRAGGATEVRVSSTSGVAFQTPGYEAAKEREKRAEEAEGVRLMYVAATRAKDHLVVSRFRRKDYNRCYAALIETSLTGAAEGLWSEVPPSVATAPTQAIASRALPRAGGCGGYSREGAGSAAARGERARQRAGETRGGLGPLLPRGLRQRPGRRPVAGRIHRPSVRR